MKLRAEILKDMLSKAVKAASDNKLIPITSLLKIEAKDGVITLETTDATNYLYIKGKTESTDSLYAVVNVDIFSKLIARTTSEFVELSVTKDIPILKVKGNGDYTIEMPLDENGGLIIYPDPVAEITDFEFEDTVKRSVVNTILTSVKPSLATTYENPCYVGYYVGDQILATDSYKIAGLNEVFMQKEAKETLISPELMDLLGVVTADIIKVKAQNNRFVYITDEVIVYGPEMDGKEDFAVDAIEGLLDTEFENTCKLNKNSLLSVLDRLSLFISPYDKNAIRLTFAKDGLQISSKASSGIEVIPYKDTAAGSFTCEVDIEMLIQEVKAIQSDTVSLQYGEENAIKLVDDNLSIVIALLEE